MNKYVYAKLFIKLAKALAAITLALGVIFTIAFGYIKIQKIHELNYHPSAELEIYRTSLVDTYEKTKSKVLESLSLKEFDPDKIQLVNLDNERKTLLSTPEHLIPEAQEQVALKLKESSAHIKEYHKSVFDQSIQTLRSALLGYASQIKSELPPAVIKPSISPIPSTNTIKSYSLFDDKDKYDDYKANLLSKIRNRLLALQQESTKIENIEATKKAILSIDCMFKLLYVPDEQSSNSEEKQNNIEPLLNSEKIAQRLMDDQIAANNNIYNDWKLDAQIEKLLSLAREEIVKRNDLKTKQSIYILDSILEAFLIIIIIITSSFFLMVLADMISAFINMSNNTDIFQAYASGSVDTTDPEQI